MNKLFFILFFYCASFGANAAITTTSLNGEITVCGANCQVLSFLPGDLVQMNFSFDDSFFGTTISEADVDSWDITLTTQNIGTLSYATSNQSITLSLDAVGKIIGGTASSDILVVGNLFNIAVDFGQPLPFLGPIVDWTNSYGSSVIFGGCFDEFSCSSVPLPGALWFFGSALFSFFGINRLRCN